MKIQEFAQWTGLPAKTIRYYESIGLLAAPEFWMHQQEDEPSLNLDPSRFKQYVQTVLERTVFND